MSQSLELPRKQKVLARLLQQSADGDWQAFGKLYALTSAQMYGLMLSMTNYAHACEDLLQEAYLSVWDRAGNYNPDKAQVMTWLTTIVRNKTLDWLRSQSAGINRHMDDRNPEAVDLAAGGAAPDDVAQRAANSTALTVCLDTLSDDQRQAVVLAFIEGHSHGELADRLATPLGTVKSWVRRGLDRLKDCLTGIGGQP